ncbi:hypothetical protein TRVL_08390 [Trypanosoma vivax]|nr:hypothetical protein TRVL_08390 [Trypanosoma vivax]
MLTAGRARGPACGISRSKEARTSVSAPHPRTRGGARRALLSASVRAGRMPASAGWSPRRVANSFVMRNSTPLPQPTASWTCCIGCLAPIGAAFQGLLAARQAVCLCGGVAFAAACPIALSGKRFDSASPIASLRRGQARLTPRRGARRGANLAGGSDTASRWSDPGRGTGARRQSGRAVQPASGAVPLLRRAVGAHARVLQAATHGEGAVFAGYPVLRCKAYRQ